MGISKKKMIQAKNLVFIISMILFSNALSTSMDSPAVHPPKKVLNSDLIGTSNENGTFVWKKKAGGENWQLEAVRQMRADKMTKIAEERIKKQKLPTPSTWFDLIREMAIKVTALSRRKATKEDWEILAYEEKVLTIRLMKVKKVKDNGGSCEKLARAVMKRTVLVAEKKIVFSFERCNKFLLASSRTCKSPHKPKPKPAPRPVPVQRQVYYYYNYFLGNWNGLGYTCDAKTPQIEVVNIRYSRGSLYAMKLLGDNCVPARKLSFEGRIPSRLWQGMRFPVKFVIGSPKYPASRQVPNFIQILDLNTFRVGRHTFYRVMGPGSASPHGVYINMTPIIGKSLYPGPGYVKLNPRRNMRSPVRRFVIVEESTDKPGNC